MAEEGCRAKRILAVWGGTRNAAWMQMVSDIAGITQVIPEQQIGASYGDAFLAGIGVGMFRDTAEVRRWVRSKGTMSPDAGAHARYDGYYRIYRDLYRRNADGMRSLGGLTRQGATASPPRTAPIPRG
jgi:xylulokinase